MQFFKDLSLSAATAGFVAVLVGFTSSVAIVFQAAQAFGATPGRSPRGCGPWAGHGPVLAGALAHPAPAGDGGLVHAGRAVLATAGLAGAFSMGEAVGAFMVCALLITLAG